jgi:hypothetical protein
LILDAGAGRRGGWLTAQSATGCEPGAVEIPNTSLPEADTKRQYYPNLVELLGASGLALFSVTPAVMSVQWFLINGLAELFGLTPFPLPVDWLLLLATLAVAVWSAFRVVEWYYER